MRACTPSASTWTQREHQPVHCKCKPICFDMNLTTKGNRPKHSANCGVCVCAPLNAREQKSNCRHLQLGRVFCIVCTALSADICVWQACMQLLYIILTHPEHTNSYQYRLGREQWTNFLQHQTKQSKISRVQWWYLSSSLTFSEEMERDWSAALCYSQRVFDFFLQHFCFQVNGKCKYERNWGRFVDSTHCRL